MATTFTAIDLSQLPEPEVVEQLDYEQILAAMLADLQARDPEFTALVESDPAYKVLEVAAYRELLIRRRANDSALAVMLAYAQGTDLDQIGANYSVLRLVLDEGDPLATPPVLPIYELDEDYKKRIQLSFEGYTTAGSHGSYVFHGLSASADVKDIAVTSHTPGVVSVYVLSNEGSGHASPSLISAVSAALNADSVRPLTDQVVVSSAQIVPFTVDAKIYVGTGPDRQVVQAGAVAALTKMLSEKQRLGGRVSLGSIYAALQQPGVDFAQVLLPTSDIITTTGQAPYCTGVAVELEAAP